ncbi:hypothetical protein N234_37685 [Ralstonia pickettii DTP0602]|nr:hypothetical protein N234_37685 [Ralstonia pickettii DTP0602]
MIQVIQFFVKNSCGRGSVTLLALNNAQFAKLCHALDRADWLEDPRFADNAARMAHAALLNQQVTEKIATRTTAQWQDILSRHDVLHAPVRSPWMGLCPTA